MSVPRPTNMTLLGTLDAELLIEAFHVVSFARSPLESDVPHPMTGTLLCFWPGRMLVGATNNDHFAYEVLDMPGVIGEGMLIVVPDGFIDALAVHGVTGPDIDFSLGDSGDVLHVLDVASGAEFAQPLWNSDEVSATYAEYLGGTATSSATVPIRLFDPLLDTADVAGPVKMALTPRTIILRDQTQMLGTPVEAEITGVPVLIDLGYDAIQGVKSLLARSPLENSDVVVDVFAQQGRVKFQTASPLDSDGNRYFTRLTYISHFESRFVPLPDFDPTILVPGGAYVPETYSDQWDEGVDEEKPDVDEVLAKFEAITGQQAVKNQVHKLVTQADLASRRAAVGLKGAPLALNFVFTGPPGTGKTTVARLLAELLSALEVLPTSKLVEVDRPALVASFIGGTEEKTLAAIENAMGGVLFIDEAYALAGVGGNDFGKQAVETLLKEIEDRRGQFACVVAGYTDKMEDFLASNPGMRSRFTQFISFEPYSAAQLLEIGTGMARAGDNVLDDEARALLMQRLSEEEMRGGFEHAGWGNARSMRNIMEAAVAQRDLRISSAGLFDLESMSTLSAADVSAACEIYRIGRSAGTGERVEDVLAELAEKVGQPALKQQVEVLVSSAKVAQLRAEHGLGPSAPDLPHLLFTGPPGTGKTTIARVLARLYKSLGVLASGHVVEVDQSDLVSSNIGGTAELTTKKIDEAIGGVLFIDEAYTLAQGNQFGAEAINTLLKRMSDDQGKFLVIAAGYTNGMQDFLKANDGLSRRFATKIEFETYTADELAQIAVSMCGDLGERLDDDAENLLKSRLAGAENAGLFEHPGWGNAGAMANLIRHAVGLRNQRLTRDPAAVPSREALVVLTAADLDPACDALFGVAAAQEERVEDILLELQEQVGQPQLKQQIEVLVTGAKAAKLRAQHGLGEARPDLPHLMFIGPPGTGKTSIARLIARLYKALGLLPSGHVVEVDQSKLVAGYIGQTPGKTAAKIDEAMGGVLFIDEAYTLAQGGKNSFGREAVETLLKRMTDDSGKFLVIAAGYGDAMEQFLKMNDGLSRRFPTKIKFEAYTASELTRIAQLMAKARGETLDQEAVNLLGERLETAERSGAFAAKDWGNAGSVENLIGQATRLRNLRLFSDPSRPPSGEDLITLTADDVAAACDGVLGSAGSPRETVESVLAELQMQIGQPALKRQVSALMAGVRAQQARTSAGLAGGGSLIEHLVFTGPPGTGKTTIARLLARLYKALGVLPGGHVVEVDRAGLVAGYLGQTATKTEEQIAKAMGGVLFIDEAYTLAGDAFGREAIDTLLARMENDRGKFMVISAGYPKQMDDFLKSNPGLPSRFTQKIDFQPYTAVELVQIAVSMAKGKGESLSDGAVDVLADRLAAAELRGMFNGREWGNARAVRNVIDKAVKARNSRLYTNQETAPTVDEMTLITTADIKTACDADGLAEAVGTGQHGGYRAETAQPTISTADRELARAGIKEIVGRAAQKLAPGITPGKSAPVGPELARLGFAEMYWQGGSSMGLQIRFTAGSRDRMHYFAGGSNGNLPDVAGYMGKQVPEEEERKTVDTYPLRTLAEWQASKLELADYIVESIRADLQAHPEQRPSR